MTGQVSVELVSIVVANLGALIAFFVRLNNRIAALEIIVREKNTYYDTQFNDHKLRLDTQEELLRSEIQQLNDKLSNVVNQLNRILGRLETGSQNYDKNN